MKDYYSILGIDNDASPNQIKTAYRKLSVKFHPDQNRDDEYFRKRFFEINEAYETLSSTESRKKYDKALMAKVVFEPIIDMFESGNHECEFGNKINVSWKTSNADVVTIQGLGDVSPTGTDSLVCNDFLDKEFVVKITAKNSYIDKAVHKEIKIANKTYWKFRKKVLEDVAEERQKAKTNTHRDMWFLVAILFSIFALMALYIRFFA